MKLSEYKNEDALDLLADILEPTAKILADAELKKLMTGGGTKIAAIQYSLKNHGKEVVDVLARLNNVEREEYSANIGQMTAELLEIVNDKELMGFFTSQEQTTGEKSFGRATASTKAKRK